MSASAPWRSRKGRRMGSNRSEVMAPVSPPSDTGGAVWSRSDGPAGPPVRRPTGLPCGVRVRPASVPLAVARAPSARRASAAGAGHRVGRSGIRVEVRGCPSGFQTPVGRWGPSRRRSPARRAAGRPSCRLTRRAIGIDRWRSGLPVGHPDDPSGRGTRWRAEHGAAIHCRLPVDRGGTRDGTPDDAPALDRARRRRCQRPRRLRPPSCSGSGGRRRGAGVGATGRRRAATTSPDRACRSPTSPSTWPPVWPSEPGQQLMMIHLDISVDDLDVAVGVGRRGRAPASATPNPSPRSPSCSTRPATPSASSRAEGEDPA